MAIVGHGIDLIECDRVEHVWRQHPERFLARILTPAERAYCLRHKHPVPHIAGRFAAKEAILKLLGTGWRGPIAWTDMEIVNDPAGRPVVRLGGHVARLAADQGIARVHLSITHTQKHAAASAIGLTD
jgi:holo-[acyl-carrier protein] synthase